MPRYKAMPYYKAAPIRPSGREAGTSFDIHLQKMLYPH
jgi:hypothetical protein